MEVLVARYRLGEKLWTFTNSSPIKAAATVLERKGLIHTMSGQVERTFRASLTQEGIEASLGANYIPPVQRQMNDRLRHKLHASIDAVLTSDLMLQTP